MYTWLFFYSILFYFHNPHQTTFPFLFQMAFKYLSWLLFPLLACFAVYSLFYQEHRGWYSWVLNMLYGFLLTFGKRYCSSSLVPQYWLTLLHMTISRNSICKATEYGDLKSDYNGFLKPICTSLQEELDHPSRSLTGGYIIKSAFN